MSIARVIPVLLFKDRCLYKGIKYRDHSYLGDPINAVRIFNDKEVDELVVLDIGDEGIDFDFLSELASEAFMPLAYGGNITKLSDAERIFSMGYEKVVLNTVLQNDLSLLSDLSSQFGRQSVVASIDVKKNLFGKRKVVFENSTKGSKFEPLEFAKCCVDAGAGEVLLGSVDNDGLGNGYDLELITSIAREVETPVVCSGGAGSFEDFRLAVECGASAVAAGSIFLFNGPHRALLLSYPGYDEIQKIFKK